MFNSNFQSLISRRDVKDGDDASLTREPEQIQAYRDTWTLGIHSYLTYLRDRLLLARELLADTGSIFVEIPDENIHHVREVMDEVFGVENLAGQVVVQKTGGLGTSGLKAIADQSARSEATLGRRAGGPDAHSTAATSRMVRSRVRRSRSHRPARARAAARARGSLR